MTECPITALGCVPRGKCPVCQYQYSTTCRILGWGHQPFDKEGRTALHPHPPDDPCIDACRIPHWPFSRMDNDD